MPSAPSRDIRHHILFDVTHPAHAHFFRHPTEKLIALGHRVTLTSRDKDVNLQLLDEFGFAHQSLSRLRPGSIGLLREMLEHDWGLYRVIRRERPDCLAAIGGTFIAHAGWLARVPRLVFYDTENATLQNRITYPFASHVYVPRAYAGDDLPARRHTRYPGYHELSYLHPDVFTPDRERAVAAGLNPDGDTFLLRLVSWQASHDIGEIGWNEALLDALIAHLAPHGRVLISSEAALPERFRALRYPGGVSDLHHVLAHCRLYVGESATIASEAAVLGVPAIYAAHTGRGYTDEQEARYHLVHNLRSLAWQGLRDTLDAILAEPRERWAQRRRVLLGETLPVADYVVEQCLTWAAR